MFLLTLAGWAAALLMARLMRSTIIRGESTPFVMELPPYRVPTLRSVVTHCWERTWMYLKKAGTVLVAVSILIWASMTFPTLDPEQAAPLETQIAALQEKVDALPEGDEARTPLEEELAAVQATLAGRILAAFLGRTSRHGHRTPDQARGLRLAHGRGSDWRLAGQGSHCFHARTGLFAWRAGS